MRRLFVVNRCSAFSFSLSGVGPFPGGIADEGFEGKQPPRGQRIRTNLSTIHVKKTAFHVSIRTPPNATRSTR